MFKSKVFTHLILGLILSLNALAQGIPFLHFYSNEEYKAGALNWKIAQSTDGILYFANNEGLLEFDGSQWKVYPLAKKTNLRSIHYANDRLYAGGQNELGFYEREASGTLTFNSLVQDIPARYRNFEDVWDIYSSNKKLFFRASDKIYILDLGGSDAKVWIDHEYRALESINESIYSQIANEVYVYDDESWQPTNTKFASVLTGVFQLNERNYFVSRKNGICQEGTKVLPRGFEAVNEMLKTHQCFDVVQLPNGNILFTTAFAGVIICSAKGQIINIIGKNDGLGNNSVPAALVDLNENVWLGLDNGISFIETNAHFNRVFPDGELRGSGQGFIEHKGQSYFSTSSGLYKLIEGADGAPAFQLIKHSEGQNWGLDLVDNNILLSHGEGAFIIKNDKAIKLSTDDYGFWRFLQLEKDSNQIYAGTYKGIQPFEKSANGFELKASNIGIEESSRFLEEDTNGDLWMSHPYRGVFRIEKLNTSESPVIITLGSDDGLLSNTNNHVFKIKGELLVCAEKGIYYYDPSTKKLLFHEQLNELLGAETKTRRLFESPKGNIWYITENDVGRIKIAAGIVDYKVEKQSFPEIASKLNRGFEKIFFTSDNKIYLTATDGFLEFNPRTESESREEFQIVLKKIIVNNERAAFLDDGETLGLSDSDDRTLNHKNNNLAFSVGATSYLQSSSLRYQYWLEGFDEAWGNWTESGTKEYTNLPSGSYTFRVRAKNFSNQIKEKTIASFEIDAPWYKSKLAYAFGFILLLALLFWLNRRSDKKISAIEEKADSKIQNSRLEVQRLENEKIQQELAHKNRELISATAHLLQKNETIESLTNDLVQIKKNVQNKESNKEIERLIRVLKTDSTKDKDWNQFMMHFNDLNRDFFVRLKEEFPALTPKDLKLCAYLKMNLSSKEIATLLNVSVRGVEASRYRLRKKMSLGSEENITELMLQY